MPSREECRGTSDRRVTSSETLRAARATQAPGAGKLKSAMNEKGVAGKRGSSKAIDGVGTVMLK